MGQNINQNIRNQVSKKKEIDYQLLLNGVQNNDLVSLAKALTLIENKNFEFSVGILKFLSNLKIDQKTLRIGISGPPGVGKSTFIESLGLKLINHGKKVAVLAIDPSSELNRGSILGDKTRMEQLSKVKGAYIRPSSNALESGGVRSSTYDAIKICEAAGYDFILVETVGVGQSEIEVSKVTDIMILMLPPAGGDELQGIKKGILEMADIILINKADSGLETFAASTLKEHKMALHISRPKQVILDEVIFRKISAMYDIGIAETIADILNLFADDVLYEKILAKRLMQEQQWFKIKSQALLIHKISKNPKFQTILNELKGERDIYRALINLSEKVEKIF